MTQMLKAGVVGAGVFGGYHAKKYAQLAGVDLVGVYDLDTVRAAELTNPLGARPFSRLDDLLAEADVVTIATPAITHAKAALQALAAGKSVYVEKPIAVALDQADALVSEAARRGLILACGHQERAVFQAMGLLAIPERPLRLEAVRTGPQQMRSLDVSVVLDLMIHDLDLALTLAGSGVIAVEAEGARVQTDLLDKVTAEATFANGFTAVLEASRVDTGRRRAMRLIYPSGVLVIDFISRTFENSTPYALDAGFAETEAGRDPLGASVGVFLAAVRGDAPRPLVTGEEAALALDLALAVEHAAD